MQQPYKFNSCHFQLPPCTLLSTGIYSWKSMYPPSSIILARKITPSPVWCVVNSRRAECAYWPCLFHWKWHQHQQCPWAFWVLLQSSIPWCDNIQLCWLQLYSWVTKHGNELSMKSTKYPDQFIHQHINRYPIVYYLPNKDQLTQWKIAPTKEMIVIWLKSYHTILAHPGWKHSWMTIQARYYHPDIRKATDDFHSSVSTEKDPT